MVKGYILIKLTPGFEASVLSQIRAIPGVLEVSLVFGRWDAIVIAEAKSLFALVKIIVSEIRGIQGVDNTETLMQGEL